MKKIVKLEKEEIEKMFKVDGVKSTDVIVNLFELVYGKELFEKIKKINGHPKINEETNKQFFRLFIDLDEQNKVDHFKGGPWLNYGFSSVDNEHLEDWEVEVNDNYELSEECKEETQNNDA